MLSDRGRLEAGEKNAHFAKSAHFLLQKRKFICVYEKKSVILQRKTAKTIKIMIPVVARTSQQFGLNPMQLHLVSMLNFNSTKAAEQRLKVALEQFYLTEFNQMKEHLYASGELTEAAITEGANRHFRTPY